MRKLASYATLLLIKGLARLFYRFEVDWVGSEPAEPWGPYRLVAILNHTSLYEPLFAGGVPNGFLRDIARRAVVPIAMKTTARPLVGRFYQLVAPEVVPITRRRDHTWRDFASRIDRDAMVVILPEGRMKRADGLDSEARPMTVRGGVAEILELIGEGRMLLAYSGGLHHVQIPGQTLPRLFRTLRMRFESLDIDAYRRQILSASGEAGFRAGVVRDLERRRNRHCPITPETDPGWPAVEESEREPTTPLPPRARGASPRRAGT